MLQHVLKDMRIDPELLAGLEDIEKETLFCCMREEQLRRWRIWDKEDAQSLKNQSTRIRKPNQKSVKWLMNDMGELVVDVIWEPSAPQLLSLQSVEEKCTPINVDCKNEDSRLKIKDDRNENSYSTGYRPTTNEGRKFTNVITNVSTTCKNNLSLPDVASFNEKRGALEELSLNKVPKVARQVAEWESRVKMRAECNIHEMTGNRKSFVSQCKFSEPASRFEIEQEHLWREQQKKAKETELRMRKIARIAREEHRRSLIENSNDVFHNFILNGGFSPEVEENKLEPVGTESLIEWFKADELLRNTEFADNPEIAS